MVKTVMDNHEMHDAHLMNVMSNMINSLGVQDTFSHSNTIRVTGDGLGDVLNVLVGQVPVLNMKVYKVAPRNIHDTDQDVHIMYFSSILLDHHDRMTKKGIVVGV